MTVSTAHGNNSLVRKKNKALLTDPQTQYILREFQLTQDYPAVYALWQHSGPGIQIRRSDEPGEIAKKVERDPDLFVVADVDGIVVGTVIGGFDGRRGMMYHLVVAPEYRKQGIGIALMEELERRLQARGCLRYYCLVTKDNLPALHFYEAHGWQSMDLFALGKDL